MLPRMAQGKTYLNIISKILSRCYQEVLKNALLGKAGLLSQGKWEGSVTQDICNGTVKSIQESPAENICYGSAVTPAGGRAISLAITIMAFLQAIQ